MASQIHDEKKLIWKEFITIQKKDNIVIWKYSLFILSYYSKEIFLLRNLWLIWYIYSKCDSHQSITTGSQVFHIHCLRHEILCFFALNRDYKLFS